MSVVNLDYLQGFESLEASAAELNSASDRANRLLASIEGQIVRLNIGLEFWHATPIEQSDPIAGQAPYATSSRIINVLGLCKIAGNWCLAVKPVRVENGYFEGDTSSPYQEQVDAGEPTPLLKAARGLRLAALNEMAAFLSALDNRIKAAVLDLNRATGQIEVR